MVFYSAVSTLPLISIYIATNGQTSVLLPTILRGYSFSIFDVEVVSKSGIFNLGPFYYIYLFLLIIFCLNSINILAGVNGLEAGQTAVIGFGFITYNLIELSKSDIYPGNLCG